MKIHWPDGGMQELNNIPSNTLLVVEQKHIHIAPASRPGFRNRCW